MSDGRMIPAALCGRHKTVKPKWRSITKKAVKAGTWKGVLETIEWIPLDKAPGMLVLRGPYPTCQGDNVLLFEVQTALHDVAYEYYRPDREKWYTAMRDLTLERADELWACLTMLSGVGFPKCETYECEKVSVRRQILSHIMAFWDELRALDLRFSSGGDYLDRPEVVGDGWRMWCNVVAAHSRDIGMPEEEVLHLRELDQVAAGEHIRRWIAASG